MNGSILYQITSFFTVRYTGEAQASPWIIHLPMAITGACDCAPLVFGFNALKQGKVLQNRVDKSQTLSICLVARQALSAHSRMFPELGSEPVSLGYPDKLGWRLDFC